MRIRWDSIWLTDETGQQPQFGLTLNGRQIVQEEQFLRAAAEQLFPRANRVVRLAFRSERTFSTIKAAELFVAGHYDTLVNGPATLTLRCGLDSESPVDVLVQNAVLESIEMPVYRGTSVTNGYRFAAPRISAIYTPPAEGEVRSGTLSINNGVSTQTFTGLAFPSAPARVLVNVVKPSGGMQIFGTMVDGTITTDGFRVDFDAIVPATGYKLTYFAVL
jgi:hypothetical protein